MNKNEGMHPRVPDGTGETKQDRRAEIEAAINDQDTLSREEKIALLGRMRKDKLGTIMEGVFNYNGKILTDDEAEFIEQRILGLATNNLVVLGELMDRFPDLVDYFHGIMKKMDDIPS